MERELEDNRALWSLFEAVSRLDNRDESARFLRDLCTLRELEAMAERWQVAQNLALRLPYRRIHELTGASTTTVTRVAHWLRHGEGGYRLLLQRMKERMLKPGKKPGKEKS